MERILIRKQEPRKGISEIEGEAAMVSSEGSRVATEFQSRKAANQLRKAGAQETIPEESKNSTILSLLFLVSWIPD
jgi:hypothetical protein